MDEAEWVRPIVGLAVIGVVIVGDGRGSRESCGDKFGEVKALELVGVVGRDVCFIALRNGVVAFAIVDGT